MIISRKRSELSTYNFQLYIDKQTKKKEKASIFRYLGVWLSDNLSWSVHVEKSPKAALKLRRFYQYCSTDCLKQLYRHHLECAVQVWDPCYTYHIQTLKKFSNLHLECVTGHGMRTILTQTNLQSLIECRKYLKLCYLFRVLHGHFFSLHTSVLRDLDCSLHLISTNHLPKHCLTNPLSSQMQCTLELSAYYSSLL